MPILPSSSVAAGALVGLFYAPEFEEKEINEREYQKEFTDDMYNTEIRDIIKYLAIYSKKDIFYNTVLYHGLTDLLYWPDDIKEVEFHEDWSYYEEDKIKIEEVKVI